MRQPNNQLRAARGSMSQAELADAVNAEIGRATGHPGALTAKAISDLERGRYTWPTKATRDGLCAVLSPTGPTELGFTRRRRTTAVTVVPLPVAPPITPGIPAIGAVRAVSESLQAADRQLGGGHLYPAVVSYLRGTIAPALVSPAAGPDMYAAAASFTEIAGWMCHDGGNDDRAGRHLTQALRLATASEHAGVEANVCGSLAHLAVQTGRHGDAVAYADRGAGRRHPSRRLAARLHTMRARGLAALHDTTGCRRALRDAEDALHRARDGEPAEWISHFDEGSWAAEVAWCLHHIGDLPAAETNALRVIDLRGGDRRRAQCFAQLALARILVQQGRIDEAAVLAGDVADRAGVLTSARVRKQLTTLAAALRPHAAQPVIADMLTRVAALPTAPTLVEVA